MSFLSPTYQKCAEPSTFWQFFYYRQPSKFRYTAGEIVKMWCKELDMYLYIDITLSIWIFDIGSTWDYTNFQGFFYVNVMDSSCGKDEQPRVLV